MGKLMKLLNAGNRTNFFREVSYLLNKSVSLGKPRVMEIETTSICPSQCIMCPKSYSFKRKQEHMEYELFTKIVEQISPEQQRETIDGVPAMRLFHYGSPVLYPKFYESIRKCKEKGFYVVVSEIAALVTEERARQAIDAGLDELWMMVDGMDDETFKKIRGTCASFETAVNNIKYAARYKQETGKQHTKIFVLMIKQPANAHQWEKFNSFWNEIPGVESRIANFSSFGGNTQAITDMAIELEKMNAQPEEMKRIQNCNSFRCFYPWHSVSVLVDGRVVPCCRDMNGTYVLGDLNTQSLEEIWNGERMQALRKEWISGNVTNPLCRGCCEANNEIGLPDRFQPWFGLLTKWFPNFYRRK